MRNEFGFDNIRSVEFCVSAKEDDEHANYLVPSDRSVQDALRDMLTSTVERFESIDDEPRAFELSEKYAAREALIAALDADEMAVLRSLHDEEGWLPNPHALRNPANIAYYFAVFRDQARRKLLGVRRAAQFKGVVKSRMIRLVDDSLTLVADHLFKLDNEFDFLIGPQNVYVLHPAAVEHIAEIETLVAQKAEEKALALGEQVKFADFSGIAEFVARHKRAARLVVTLSKRPDLNRVKRDNFLRAANDTKVVVEKIRRKIRPAPGFETAFLQLLDDRRYTTAIRTGPKEAFEASSRKPIRR